jgi:hypothetical protein
VYSSQGRKPVYGFSLVLLVWTNETFRLPLGLRLWHQGGPSKYALTLGLLSYARNHLRYRPEHALFDAWYHSKVLLKRIQDHAWYCTAPLLSSSRQLSPVAAVVLPLKLPGWPVAQGGVQIMLVVVVDPCLENTG